MVMELVVVSAVDSFWGRSLDGTRLLVPVVEGRKIVADVEVGVEDTLLCSGEGAV